MVFYGPWSHTVDILAVFGIMFGVVTPLGLGVIKINSGLEALKAASIVSNFPFAIVIMIMMYALLRGSSRDRLILYRNQQWFITEESADHNSANEFRDESTELSDIVKIS